MTLHKPFTFVGTLVALALLSNCSQQHYSPNIIYTPVAEKKGDATVSAALMGGENSFSGNFHASYSPMNHGLLMVNHYRTRASFTEQNFFVFPPPEPTTQSYKIQFTEGCVGAYKPISFGIGTIMAGWGAGTTQNDYGYERLANLRFNRFFVQPSFSFKNNWFRIGMGLRLVRLSFTSGEVDYRIEPTDITYIKNLETNSPIWFPEVGGNIGLTMKNVTVFGSMVLNQLADADYTVGRVNMALGLNVDLNFASKAAEKDEKSPKKKKKKGKKK
jgi:hypothetical protein